MKINSGFTYFLNDNKLGEEDKVKILVNKFRERFNQSPAKLYLNPKSTLLSYPGLEVVKTKLILNNNYHFSLE